MTSLVNSHSLRAIIVDKAFFRNVIIDALPHGNIIQSVRLNIAVFQETVDARNTALSP